MKVLLCAVFFVYSDLFQVEGQQCGVKSGFVATIFGGERVEKGEWPWMVAFIHRKEEVFFCAGSLVSKKHILSGEAVILQNKNSQSVKQQFSVFNYKTSNSVVNKLIFLTEQRLTASSKRDSRKHCRRMK